MTWLAEVRHVLAKDIHEFRWMLAVYVALVALVTARASGLAFWLPFPVAPGVIAVVIAGMIGIASVIHADAPARADAFWASHPFRSSAVLGAKISFMLLLLSIGLAAQAVGIRSYDVAGGAVARLVAATVAPTLCWFVAAMIIAIVTRDLRSFLLGIVAVPLGGYIISLGAWQLLRPGEIDEAPVSPFIITTWMWLCVVIGIGVTAYTYRSRDARRRTRLGAIIVAVLSTYGAASCATTGPDLPAENVSVPLTLELEEAPHLDQDRLDLHILGPALTRTVISGFRSREIVVQLRDGSTMRFDAQRVRVFETGLRGTATPDIPGLRWIDSQLESSFKTDVYVRLVPEERVAIARGVSAVRLEGQLITGELQSLATMPLRIGAETVSDGYRLRIMEWNPNMPELPIKIGVSKVNASVSQTDALIAALVNRRRGEGFMLYDSGSSGALDGVVLPGVPVRSGDFDFERRKSIGMPAAPRPDRAWLEDAELLIGREVPRGTQSVRLERRIP